MKAAFRPGFHYTNLCAWAYAVSLRTAFAWDSGSCDIVVVIILGYSA